MLTPMKAKTAKKAKAAKQAETAPVAKKAAAKKMGPRKDFGAPVDGFFAKQPPVLRAILDTLRKMIAEVAPDATASLKWGQPFYEVGKGTICALASHKAHVNLILSGPPEAFVDPQGRLEGTGKTGRHLKLTKLADLPRDAVKKWLKTAAELARKKTGMR